MYCMWCEAKDSDKDIYIWNGSEEEVAFSGEVKGRVIIIIYKNNNNK